MGPLDMKDLIGAATLMGTLMYGAGMLDRTFGIRYHKLLRLEAVPGSGPCETFHPPAKDC